MSTMPKPGDTIKIAGFIHLSKHGSLIHSISADMSDYGYLVVGPHEITFVVPADFNPVASEVAAIDRKLDKMAGEYHGAVAQLQQRKAELLCIENAPSEAP